MPLEILLTPVGRYTIVGRSARPVYRPADQALRIDTQTELLRVSAPISYDVDITDDSAALLKIGSLNLSVDNQSGRWTPGWGAFAESDRDHRIEVRHQTGNNASRLLWRGFVRRIEQKAGLRVDITANHELDLLEDAEVPAREDNTLPPPEITDGPRAGAHSLRQVWTLIRERTKTPLPHWAALYGGGEADAINFEPFARGEACILPDSPTDARRFVGAVLAARGRVLVHDAAGNLVGRPWGPRYNLTLRPRARQIHHVWDHLPPTIAIRPLDIKDRLRTAISFKARGPWPGGAPTDTTLVGENRYPDVGPLELGPTYTHTGGTDISTWPADHRLRYGFRELKTNFEHLLYADAYIAAKRMLLRVGYPIRRVIVERDIGDTPVGIGDIVDLRVVDPGNFAAPWGGVFWVTGHTVDIGAEKITVSLNEITPSNPALLPRAAR